MLENFTGSFKYIEDLQNPGNNDLNNIKKIDGGIETTIPNSNTNADWQQYQEWLAEGNTPLAY